MLGVQAQRRLHDLDRETTNLTRELKQLRIRHWDIQLVVRGNKTPRPHLHHPRFDYFQKICDCKHLDLGHAERNVDPNNTFVV